MSGSLGGTVADPLAQLRVLVAEAATDHEARLPAERVLARELGISRGTVRRLLGVLADEGLVLARPQSGWHLTSRAVSEPNQTLVGFSQMSRMFGHEPHSRVLSSATRLPQDGDAAKLRIASTEPVWILKRVRSLGSTPASVEVVILPTARVGDLPNVDMTDRSLFSELEAIGVEVSRTDVVVEAEVADEALAHLLAVPDGSPILSQREVGYDQHGRELFVCHAQYRADSYRFRSTLQRRRRRD